MPCDYKKYPKNWKTEIVPAVLARAGEMRESGKIIKEAECEFCGILNHSFKATQDPKTKELKLSKVVLTIAHLDHDAENHNVAMDRLKALCQKCHNQYDAPMRRQNSAKTRATKKGMQDLFN